MHFTYRQATVSLIVISLLVTVFFVFVRQTPGKISANENMISPHGAERWSVQEVGLHNSFASTDFGFFFEYPRDFGEVVVSTEQIPTEGSPHCQETKTGKICSMSFEISFSKNKDIFIYGGTPCVACTVGFKYLAGTLLESAGSFQGSYARELANGGKQIEGKSPYNFPGKDDRCEKGCLYKGQIITTFSLPTAYQRMTIFGATNPEYYKLVSSVEIFPPAH